MSYPRILTACRVSTRSELNVDARSGNRALSFPALPGGADSFRHIPLPALYVPWTRRRTACAGDPPAATGSIVSSIRCAAEWLVFVDGCFLPHWRDREGVDLLGQGFGPVCGEPVLGRFRSHASSWRRSFSGALSFE